MATFRPLLQKKKNSIRSGMAGENIYKPQWFAFSKMESFLKPVYQARNTNNTEVRIIIVMYKVFILLYQIHFII